MQIEISSVCNLDCKKCYRKQTSRRIGHMSLDLFKECIDKIDDSRRLDKNLYLSGFGESMLNPNFGEMIKYAKLAGFKLMLTTNGTLINKLNIKDLRAIDLIQLSIDHIDDGRINLVDAFKMRRIPIQLNITIGRDNYNELQKFISFGIKKDVPLYFMMTTAYNHTNKSIEDDYKFCISKYNEIFHTFEQFFADITLDSGCDTFKRCRYRNHDFSIDWLGNLKPCNDALLSTKYDFGNIHDYDNLDDFLDSDDYYLLVNGLHPICNMCKRNDNYLYRSYIPEVIYDKRLDYYKDLHKGRKCFVLGHAPTLTKEIIDLVMDEITLSVNLIGHAKTKWGFEPTYFAIGDCVIVTKSYLRKFIDMLETSVKFYPRSIIDQSYHSSDPESQLTEEHIDYLNKNMIPVNWINPSIGHNSLIMPNPEAISFDLRRGVLESGTSIQQMAIPIASWIGCSEIYLAGCDIGYKGRFYDHDGMITDNGPWPGPDIFRQYGWMATKLAEHGQMLYNMGPSKIPGVPNKTLDEIFK